MNTKNKCGWLCGAVVAIVAALSSSASATETYNGSASLEVENVSTTSVLSVHDDGTVTVSISLSDHSATSGGRTTMTYKVKDKYGIVIGVHTSNEIYLAKGDSKNINIFFRIPKSKAWDVETFSVHQHVAWNMWSDNKGCIVQ